MNVKIPIYQPYLKGNIKKYVNDCIDTSWISSRGKYIHEFEKKFAEYTGTENAVAVSNGTVAIHLALLALDIKDGDEIIVPTLTYIATVNPVKYVGATPVFVDARHDTWQIDHEKIREKISSKTKAIIVTHLYGQPCEMNEIVKICKEYNLFLIEDCAEAIGTKYKKKHVGTFSDIATFSFYGNKTITTGEGGMVVAKNKNLSDKVLKLKMQGVSPVKRYWHEMVGYNYKMTNICAAIGLAQLEIVDIILQKKAGVSKWYTDYFKKTEIEFQRVSENEHSPHWMFSILVKNNRQREALIKYLLERFGIETRPTFYPVHTMPMYSQNKLSFPVSENIGLRGINLPSSPELTKSQIQFISETICNFVM